jgi:hypothetical protein
MGGCGHFAPVGALLQQVLLDAAFDGLWEVLCELCLFVRR